VYKQIHSVSDDSDLRIFLYKLLFEALPSNQRFNNRKKRSCYLCNKEIESVSHLFYKCNKVSMLFNQNILSLLENKFFILSKSSFWFNISLTKHDYKIISIFLYSVWLLRDKIRSCNKPENYKLFFKNIFNKKNELLSNS
jgi:hypothetical protein